MTRERIEAWLTSVARSRANLALLWGAQMVVTWIFALAWGAHLHTIRHGSSPWGGFDAEDFRASLGSSEMWGTFVAYSAVVFAAQVLFVWPVRKARARRKRGRSLWLSLALASTAATVLAAGLGLAFLDVWQKDPSTGALAALPVSWGFFTVLLVAYVKARPHEASEALLAKIARGLFRGTVVEALLLIPFDVILRQRRDCYCLAGSVIGYAACLCIGTLFLGPAIFLPLLLKGREMTFFKNRCDACATPLDPGSGHAKDHRSPPTTGECPSCKLPFAVHAGVARTLVGPATDPSQA